MCSSDKGSSEVGIMNWEKDEVVRLIEEYRKQRCLWDVQLPQYKDKQKKCDAWKVLGIAVNRTWVEVEKKMKSCSCTYLFTPKCYYFEC